VEKLVEVKAKDRESFDSLLRRFKKRLQMSRDQITARQRRFFEPPKNKRKIKEDALRRSKLRAEKAYLEKIGKTTNKYGTGKRTRSR